MLERWLWLQPHWNWEGFSFLATFTTGWADALGVHPFNHSHCRFLPQSTTPGKTWWFHDTFNQHQTHNISVTKAAKPRTPPPPTANPCRAGILSQYFSPTDILLERFGGKIWKRHSEGWDKWQVIHIKGLKQNRYFLLSRWSLIKTLEIPKEIRADCATLNFTSSYCASTSSLLLCFHRFELFLSQIALFERLELLQLKRSRWPHLLLGGRITTKVKWPTSPESAADSLLFAKISPLLRKFSWPVINNKCARAQKYYKLTSSTFCGFPNCLWSREKGINVIILINFFEC